MRVLLPICLAIVLTAPAHADPCRVERGNEARSICLAHQTEQRRVSMQARIEQVLSGLQALNGSELRALASRYRVAQAEWAKRVSDICTNRHPARRVEREECRLAATIVRLGDVDASLARASRDFGGPPAVAVQKEIEILVPLSPPNAGAAVFPRLRLNLPYLGD